MGSGSEPELHDGQLSVRTDFFWRFFDQNVLLLDPRHSYSFRVSEHSAIVGCTTSTISNHSIIPLLPNITSRYGTTPTMIPSGMFWISQKMRYLIPEEMMFLQGFPVHEMCLGNLSDAKISSLAGNAMSVPVMGACMLVVFANCDVLGRPLVLPSEACGVGRINCAALRPRWIGRSARRPSCFDQPLVPLFGTGSQMVAPKRALRKSTFPSKGKKAY